MKKINFLSVITALTAISFMSSCSKSSSPSPNDNTSDCTVTAPANYSFDHEGTSTVFFTGQADRLAKAKELYNAINTTSGTPTASSLLLMFGENGLSGKVAEANSNNNALTDVSPMIETLLTDFATNAPLFAAGDIASAGNAGLAGPGSSYGLDAKGWEADQLYAKTLIGALCLQQVAHDYLTKMDVDNVERNPDSTGYAGQVCTKREHYYDEAFGYVYGMDADPLTAAFEEIAGNKYEFLGKYLAKHNANNQYSGVDYVNIVYDAFKMGRAAVVAECEDELNAQIDIINNALSDVVAWHAEGYLRSSTNYLDSLGNISSPSYFHYVSEAWGFVRALEFTKSTNYTFSATDVQNMITTLDANGAGAWGLTDAHLIGLADEIQAKTGLPTATSFTNLVGLE